MLPVGLAPAAGACHATSVGLSDNLATRAVAQDAELALAPVTRRSAAADVRAQLRELIESGQLQVDDRLPSEAELSRRFGVSRPIVREALGSLHALGLTESRPGRGTFVASNFARATLTFGQYSSSDLNEVRRCLEVPAAGLAAERRRPQGLAALRRVLEEHDRTTTVEDAVRYDALLHCEIGRVSGNPLFARLIGNVREILQEQSLAVSALRGRGREAAREHHAIVAAIADGDRAAAEAAMSAHLDAVEHAIAELAGGRRSARRTHRGGT